MEDFQQYNLSEFEAILVLGIAFGLLMVLAQLLHQFGGVSADHTRKLVHFGTGAICVLSPYNFTDHRVLLASGTVFLLVLLVTRRNGRFSSVHGSKYHSIGDLLLPIVIYLNFLLFAAYGFDKVFYLPLIILTICDPAAFYGGFIFKKDRKSFVGFLFFFITALLSTWIALSIYSDFTPATIWTIAILAGALGGWTEYLSKNGWDNLTVPFVVALILVVHAEFYVHGAN